MKHIDLWNQFIDEVYGLFLRDNDKRFSNEQKNAIIAFAYDAEVNSGGHIGFFDGFGDTFTIDEVAEALRKTAGEKFASNFLSAAIHIHYTDDCGYLPDEDSDSDPVEDDIYYEMIPTLPDLLEAYIFDNRESIFLIP
ncbi:hypothetical protein LJC63_01850 [Ruminococcaceae bacterium OttesenSCG-928-L11]|nr:hypothetical protein [Ruminococcaceae bacterium OttesenSCG-928-L11]